MRSHIHDRPVFEKLLFAQSWEDPELDIEALQIQPSDRILVVTSGGCNALSLLTTGPREMIAIDMNPVQGWLMELKLAGIRTLSHDEYLRLLGVRFLEEPSPNHNTSIEVYGKVRGDLSPAARSFWDCNQKMISHGVLQSGRYELYLRVFRRLLRAIQGGATVRELMNQSLDMQQNFYHSQWDRTAWRLFFRIFFSRQVLGGRGLDPEFFKYVESIGPFGEHWRRLAEHVLTDLPIRDNYFVAQICFGSYLNRTAVPRYLHPRYFETLKHHAGRVRIITEELEKFLRKTDSECVDKFALSNVFEWVDEPNFHQMLLDIWRVATPGAKLCYRNLLVRRESPDTLHVKLRSYHDLAQQLLWRDRSFVYNNFVIERVIK